MLKMQFRSSFKVANIESYEQCKCSKVAGTEKTKLFCTEIMVIVAKKIATFSSCIYCEFNLLFDFRLPQ